MSDKVELIKSEQYPDYTSDESSTVNLSEAKLVVLGSELQDRFRRYSGYRERAQWEEEKAEAFDSYHMVPKERKAAFAGAANLRCVLPRIGCDSWASNVIYGIMGNGNKPTVKPKLVLPEFQDTARRTADFLSFQLEHEADFYNVLDDALHKASIYGIAYLEPRYVKECAFVTEKETTEEVIPETDPTTGEITLRRVKKSKTIKRKKSTFDGIKIDSLPVESIYISPFARSIEDAVRNDILFKKTRRTWESIKQRSREGYEGEDPFYMPKAVKQLEGMVTKKVLQVDQNSMLEQRKADLDGFWLDAKLGQEALDLVEAHLWKDIDGDNIPEKICVTFEAETGIILRVSMAPCRIVEIRPWPVDERFYGHGLPKITEQICTEWEAIHNMRVNAGQWENTVFGFFRASGRFDPSAITIQPGMFYPVDSPHDVSFAPTPTVRNSYFQEEGLLINYFERVTALTENIQGVTNQRQSTATEQMQATQKASIRLSNPLTRVVMALEKMLGHMVDLNRECAPEDKEYAVSGVGSYPVFSKVSRNDYNTQLSFKLDINTVFDEEMERNKWLLVYRMFIQDPNVAQHPASAYELSMNTLRALGVRLNVPKPPQAKIVSPLEKIEMIKAGIRPPEPAPGEDTDEALKIYMSIIQSDKIKEWKPEWVKELMVLVDETKILQQTLQAGSLNQSGMVPPGMLEMLGGAGAPGGTQPGITASRNPNQKNNVARVGQTSMSELNNAQQMGSNESPNAPIYNP